MIILEWLIWVFTLLLFIAWLCGIRKDAREGVRPVLHALLMQTILLLLCVIYFAFSSWNKLNLLWVIPVSLLSGFVLGFGITPIPFIGFILRRISLVFAHIFLIGTEWEIGGFPWSGYKKKYRDRLESIHMEIMSLKEAIRIKPDDAEAHYKLGITYLLLGERSSALDEYKILKELGLKYEKDREKQRSGSPAERFIQDKIDSLPHETPKELADQLFNLIYGK